MKYQLYTVVKIEVAPINQAGLLLQHQSVRPDNFESLAVIQYKVRRRALLSKAKEIKYIFLTQTLIEVCCLKMISFISFLQNNNSPCHHHSLHYGHSQHSYYNIQYNIRYIHYFINLQTA